AAAAQGPRARRHRDLSALAQEVSPRQGDAQVVEASGGAPSVAPTPHPLPDRPDPPVPSVDRTSISSRLEILGAWHWHWVCALPTERRRHGRGGMGSKRTRAAEAKRRAFRYLW